MPLVSTGEQIRAGTVVPLAVTATERHPAFPAIPTFAEFGYPEVRGTTWFWLAGPKNLSADVVDRLAQEVRRLVKDSAMQQRFAADAILTMESDRQALNRFLAEEIAFWGALARKLGLKVQ